MSRRLGKLRDSLSRVTDMAGSDNIAIRPPRRPIIESRISRGDLKIEQRLCKRELVARLSHVSITFVLIFISGYTKEISVESPHKRQLGMAKLVFLQQRLSEDADCVVSFIEALCGLSGVFESLLNALKGKIQEPAGSDGEVGHNAPFAP
jgi:hypothetical protein